MNARLAGPGLAAALFVLAAQPVFAADRYHVATQLSHGGAEFAKPALLLVDGQEARIEKSGDDGFTLVVTPFALPNGRINLKTALSSPYGSMSPSMTMALGEPATISNGDIEMRFVVSRVP